MLDKARLRGVWTALITPFTADDHVDVDALRALIREQVDAGVAGLVPCGTTGETATLTIEEQNLVIETTLDEVKGRVAVVAGAGANCTRTAIANHQRVAGLRGGGFAVDGALHVTPWYNKPTQEGLYQHFLAVAQCLGAGTELPIVLYNVPGRTGCDLLPETIIRLRQADASFVGVKEATGSVQRSQELLNQLERAGFENDVAILSGDDGHILSLLALGGDGVISVTSHVCAAELVRMVKAFDDGRMQEAQALSRRTSALVEPMFFRSNPIPVKTALALLGRAEGKITARFRLPLVPLTEDDTKLLVTRLTNAGWM